MAESIRGTSGLTLRSAGALLAIALVAVVGHVLLRFHNQETRVRIAVSDMASAQLAQLERTALLLRLTQRGDAQYAALLKRELASARGQLERAQTDLSAWSVAAQTPPQVRRQLEQTLYEGPTWLAQRVDDLCERLDRVLAQSGPLVSPSSVEPLIEIASDKQLLMGLERLVASIDADRQARAGLLDFVSLCLVAADLLALALAWLLVFRPMIVGVRRDLGQLQLSNRRLAAEVSERRAAEEALAHQEHEQRMLFDSVPAMIRYKDRAGRIKRVNRAGAERLGMRVEQMIGRTAFELFPPEQAEGFHRDDQEVIDSGRPKLGLIEQISGADGTVRWLRTDKIPHRDEHGEILGVIGLSVDISERVRAEEALRRKEEESSRTQRIEALGRLAGGVAHDFNNLLTAILCCADSIAAANPAPECVPQLARRITRTAERAADLTRKLLAFSRRQVFESRVVNLTTLVEETTRLLERLIGENIRVTTRLAQDLGHVRVDPAQLEQVLITLATRARDAMPDGGTLLIETANAERGLCEPRGDCQSPAAARHVCLSIADSGRDLDPELREHLFEPFYKKEGRGENAGLELATVYGIVQQSNGQIFVTSEPGVGTTFKIYLPCVDVPADITAPVVAAAPTAHRNATILLAEDDEDVRKITMEVLMRQGFRVIVGTDGQDALLRALQTPDVIDILLTDVVMPGLTGPQLAQRLATVRAGLKVLYMSGYVDTAEARQKVRMHGAAFIAKPFTFEALLNKVREVLDAPAPVRAAKMTQRFERHLLTPTLAIPMPVVAADE